MSAIDVKVFNPPSGNVVAVLSAQLPGPHRRECFRVKAMSFTDREPSISVATVQAFTPAQLSQVIELLQQLDQELRNVAQLAAGQVIPESR